MTLKARFFLLLLILGVAGNLCAQQLLPEPLKLQGIENAFRLSEKVYSGSQPEGDAGFAALQKLGIKTILSVDGTRPSLKQAAAHGIRYVHLPFGYDGIPNARQLELAKLAESADFPLYVHCHHGKHRGPAAAAIICMEHDMWTAQTALQWLKLAGNEYEGLFRDVRLHRSPQKDQLATVKTPLPQSSAVSPLADTMIQIDHHIDRIKELLGATPLLSDKNARHQATNEALLLHELFRELQRVPPPKHKPSFIQALEAATAKSARLHETLAMSEHPDSATTPAGALQTVLQDCRQCHRDHRN